MVWHAKISKPGDPTCPSQEVILHLMDIPARGEDRPRLATAEEFRSFLAAHPEVEAVNVYDSRFPRRPVPIERFGPAMVRRLFA